MHQRSRSTRDFRPYTGSLGEFNIAFQHSVSANIERRVNALDSPASYFHWGFILISMPNLLVILGMIVLFAVALIVPFPHGKEGNDGRH